MIANGYESDPLIRRIATFWKQNGLSAQGDHILCALSGGRDSVFLFHVMRALREELSFTFSAVHVHHGIRKEADGDEAFVRALAERYDVPASVIRADVPALAKEEGLSLEEAGRTARRRAFDAAAARCPEAKVLTALAHHRDDNAETVLLNLARGTGLAGLCGIRPEQGGAIHPLLCVSRGEIDGFAAEYHMAYRDDETNADDRYTRNRIRHHVLPYLEENIHSGAAEHIAEAAGFALEAQQFLEQTAEEHLPGFLIPAENGICVRQEIFDEPPALLHCMLRHIAGSLCALRDLGTAGYQAAASLREKQVGRKIELPGGLRAERTYEGVLFYRLQEDGSGRHAAADESRNGAFPGKAGNLCLILEKTDAAPDPIPVNLYTKWIDCDKIYGNLCLRTRRSGDRIAISGGYKTLKAYMIDEKIPSSQRDGIPVIADEKEVIWIAGYRLSERYKVTADTKRVLKMTLAAADPEDMETEKTDVETRPE